MKAKRIVIGAISAAVLSLSVCSLAPVFAANETVQISVSKTSANAGETFSVDVSLSNIPSNGIQCCAFAVQYDASLMTIDSVEAGPLANTSAVKDDPTSALLSIFDSSVEDEDNLISLVWSTSLEDQSEWMNGEGVFCTITGTLSADATGVIPLEVVPVSRVHPETGVVTESITVGYFDANEKVVRYGVNTVSGEVAVGGGSTTSGLKGDANEDGEVNIADAVFIMQVLSNPDVYKFTAQGAKNADVIGNDGVTAMDALEIQKVGIGLPSVFD